MCLDAPQTTSGHEYEHRSIKTSKRPIFNHLIPVYILCVDSELFPCVGLEQCKVVLLFYKHHLNTDRAVAVKTITQIYTK